MKENKELVNKEKADFYSEEVQKEEFDKEKIRESAEKYVQEYLKDDDIHVYSDESFCTCFIY